MADGDTGSSPRGVRRLRRSRSDRVIAGVCGGIGEYLGVDPVVIRIATVLLVFAGGAGIVLYLVGWIAMPESEPGETTAAVARPGTAGEPNGRTRAIVGAVLVVIGAAFLVDAVLPDWFAWSYLWPAAVIVVGLGLIAGSRR